MGVGNADCHAVFFVCSIAPGFFLGLKVAGRLSGRIREEQEKNGMIEYISNG